jgi:hypothetical protein
MINLFYKPFIFIQNTAIMKLLTLHIVMLLLAFNLTAQLTDTPVNNSEESHHEEHEALKKYKVALTLGLTHIPGAFNEESDKAIFVPTVGLDFFYFINHKWSLSFVSDLELSNYIVDFDREDLDREKALILAIQAGYEVLPSWAVLFGGGLEIEKHKNLFVLRLGTEYDIELHNNWSISPSLFFDFKEDFSTWTVAIGIGKKF